MTMQFKTKLLEAFLSKQEDEVIKHVSAFPDMSLRFEKLITTLEQELNGTTRLQDVLRELKTKA
jgi:hypothetical protein